MPYSMQSRFWVYKVYTRCKSKLKPSARIIHLTHAHRSIDPSTSTKAEPGTPSCEAADSRLRPVIHILSILCSLNSVLVVFLLLLVLPLRGADPFCVA